MVDLCPLTRADAHAALRLSTQAGWNQVEADWLRLVTLWPNSCIGGWEDGALAATGTLAVYGREAAWVGMILVDEARRGRGHAGAILGRLLEIADAAGVVRTGLDATDLGLPVYVKRGFREFAAINRWVRPAGAVASATDETTHPITGAVWDSVLKLDRAASSVDRGDLLRHLAGESNAAALMLSRHSQASAAGFLHSGRTASAIGPLVAESPSHAEKMLSALVTRAPADRPIILDTLGGSAIEPALPNFGFSIHRRLIRMFRPAIKNGTALLSGSQVFAGAGFELG